MISLVFVEERRFERYCLGNRGAFHKRKFVFRRISDARKHSDVRVLRRPWTEILANPMSQSPLISTLAEIEDVGASNSPLKLTTPTNGVHSWIRRKRAN